MKVLVVKNRNQRERAVRRFLDRRKVVAVVSSPRDLQKEVLKRADVVILEENKNDKGSNS
ncbi:MAG: hypothetical protein GXN96_02055 [Aquificae bacterium]|nr:hypothetical protein [Aquificota bacterium]